MQKQLLPLTNSRIHFHMHHTHSTQSTHERIIIMFLLYVHVFWNCVPADIYVVNRHCLLPENTSNIANFCTRHTNFACVTQTHTDAMDCVVFSIGLRRILKWKYHKNAGDDNVMHIKSQHSSPRSNIQPIKFNCPSARHPQSRYLVFAIAENLFFPVKHLFVHFILTFEQNISHFRFGHTISCFCQCFFIFYAWLTLKLNTLCVVISLLIVCW